MMPSRLYLGVDPGASGAIVALDEEAAFVDLIRCKEPEGDLADFVYRYSPDVVGCYVEKVGSMPGQGVASTFKFGTSYGLLRGILAALLIPRRFVAPTVWQRAMGIGVVKGEKKVAKKRRHKELAQELYPDLKVINATADALLIARYAVRKWSEE